MENTATPILDENPEHREAVNQVLTVEDFAPDEQPSEATPMEDFAPDEQPSEATPMEDFVPDVQPTPEEDFVPDEQPSQATPVEDVLSIEQLPKDNKTIIVETLKAVINQAGLKSAQNIPPKLFASIHSHYFDQIWPLIEGKEFDKTPEKMIRLHESIFTRFAWQAGAPEEQVLYLMHLHYVRVDRWFIASFVKEVMEPYVKPGPIKAFCRSIVASVAKFIDDL